MGVDWFRSTKQTTSLVISMREITEFYQRKQGRPQAPARKDLEGGLTLAESESASIRSEYMELKILMDKLLNEQIAQIQQLIIETKQIKWHLASVSGESIDEGDVEED